MIGMQVNVDWRRVAQDLAARGADKDLELSVLRAQVVALEAELVRFINESPADGEGSDE